MEALTAALETKAAELMAEVERRGGAVRAIADGFVQREIADAAYAAQRAVERGDDVVVGVNRFEDRRARPTRRPRPTTPRLAAKQVERLAAVRAAPRRRPLRAGAARAAPRPPPVPAAPLMEGIVEAVAGARHGRRDHGRARNRVGAPRDFLDNFITCRLSLCISLR